MRHADAPRAAGQGFARPIDVDRVPETGLDVEIEATAEERAAVAEAIGLPAIGALAGRFRIARASGSRYGVEGSVTARITQICVVSLEAFESEVEEPVEIAFAPSARPDRAPLVGRASRRRPDREPPPPTPVKVEEVDPPDPIVDGRIDLGAVAVEFLTLALDFYPRKPGVRFDEADAGESGPSPSAFAALERLKDPS